MHPLQCINKKKHDAIVYIIDMGQTGRITKYTVEIYLGQLREKR